MQVRKRQNMKQFVKEQLLVIHFHWKLMIVLILVHCTINNAHAQTFPVICRTELQAPYSLYLPDYTQVGSTRLAVNLLLQDNSVSNYAVRLRLVIEGNNLTIQTRPDYKPAPIFLNGGVNERFLGSDLEGYFRSENLLFQGISRTEYEANKRLPEGFYRIRFEVMDYNREIAVSNPQISNSTAWLLLNDPPLLNFPMQEEKVRPLPQQSMAFSWTPRHTSSPNAARNVEYEFTLVQLIPASRNPNDAVLNSIPIFQTSTRSTQLVYGIAEPNLVLGARYAWRVRARELSLDGTTGIDLFKNRGYSEVSVLTYGEPCAMPTSSSVEVLNAIRAKVSFQAGAGNTTFRVEYRKKSTNSTEWAFTNTTQLGHALIDNLEANTVYEYQVRGFCGELGNGAGSVQEFTTPALAQESISCGLPQNTIDLTNQVPKTTLSPNDTIQAADFDVKVTRVTSGGSSGRFSGEGMMVFPLANRAKVKVKFDNILVNSENRFVDGRIIVVGMGIQVLSDEVINNVNGLFTEIDALLAQAETTLAKIDEVLAKMEQVMELMLKYLPDDLLQELKSSQTALEAAKDEYERIKNDPNASETDKAKAKAELKKAREAVKKAYQDAGSYWKDALVKFVKILWRATRELGQEATSGMSSKISTFKQKEQNVENIVGKPEIETEGVSIGISSEAKEIEDVSNFSPTIKDFVSKGSFYYEAEDNKMLSELVIAIVTNYAQESDMKALGDGFKELGKDVVEFILQELKARKEETQIVNALKANIKDFLLESITIQR
ncbi:hypothetical protein AD998_21440 [bacterium 336/3]|nr:hypothetical protein AD998_21440 [bacterium 336/3]